MKLTPPQLRALRNVARNGLPYARTSLVVRALKRAGLIVERNTWPDPDQRYDLTAQGRAEMEKHK